MLCVLLDPLLSHPLKNLHLRACLVGSGRILFTTEYIGSANQKYWRRNGPSAAFNQWWQEGWWINSPATPSQCWDNFEAFDALSPRISQLSSRCSQWKLVWQHFLILLRFLSFPASPPHFRPSISSEHLVNKQCGLESLPQGSFLGGAEINAGNIVILSASNRPYQHMPGLSWCEKKLVKDVKYVKMLRRVCAFPWTHLSGSIIFPKHAHA